MNFDTKLSTLSYKYAFPKNNNNFVIYVFYNSIFMIQHQFEFHTKIKNSKYEICARGDHCNNLQTNGYTMNYNYSQYDI